MQNLVTAIKGLMPGIDRRKVAKPFVLEGKNFLMSVDGPVSGLGRTITGYKTVYEPSVVQTFKIVETQESYVCTNEGIFRFNTISKKLDSLFLFSTPVTAEFPWSSAAVGNKVYFTRPGSGLIEYDVSNDSWQVVTGGSIPSNIYACAESEGRLILLTTIVSAWSAIGDGQDFTPSTTTGAGSQVLTKLGVANPTPLGVQKTPDGYLTFLSSGIMKSQAIQSANPFRHVILSTEHIVVNPFSITLVDAEKIVFATLAGLFSTTGQIPVIYEPLMTEFFHEQIFPLLDTVNNQNSIRLYSDFARAWFIVSIAINEQDYTYDVAYLLNLRTQEWGSLNASHLAFLDFETLKANQSGFNFSLLTVDGTISRFDSSVGVENIPNLTYGLYYHKIPVDAAARENTDILYFTCRMNIRTVATDVMDVSGLYDRYSEVAEYPSPLARLREEYAPTESGGVITFRCNTDFKVEFVDINVRQELPPFDSLNSQVEIGLFRLFDEQASDRLSYVSLLAIHMLLDAVGSSYEDWLSQIQYPSDLEEDWLSMEDSVEDWGGDPTLVTAYDGIIYSSLDGYTPDITQDSVLYLTREEGRVKFYSCYTSGLYHSILLSASDVGANYATKILDMSINSGGRI